jgi:hypothetical protein
MRRASVQLRFARACLEREAELFQGVPDRRKHRHDDGRPVLFATTTEQYLEGRLSLHAHFRLRRGVDGDVGDWCAAFYRHPRVREVFDGQNAPTLGNVADARKAQARKCARSYSVLVGIGNRAEEPESFKMAPTRALVRLQALDDCQCTVADKAEQMMFPERWLVSGEWERDVSAISVRGLSIVLDGELPGDYVESRAEVVRDVANGRSELEVRFAKLHEACNVASRLRLETDLDAVRLWVASNEGVTASVEILNVSKCPVVLDPGIPMGVVHKRSLLAPESLCQDA